MRVALWLLALFGVAVAAALFAGNNQGTVTLFWPPYRIDLSLNMVLLLLVGAFALLHAALRGSAALLELPLRAQRWRRQQRERAMHGALLDALAQLLAGRFLRARRAAQSAITQQESLADAAGKVPHCLHLRTLAHVVAAEASHALQDSARREAHLQAALDGIPANGQDGLAELREGVQLRAARWALDERDAAAALERLAALPSGAARRTLALRVRLKAARLARHIPEALETARLLAKHNAFSPAAAASLLRGLLLELLDTAHDPAQLDRLWQGLEGSERRIPDVAVHAAQRLARLGGDPSQVRAWLLPVWEDMVSGGREALGGPRGLRLILTLQDNLEGLDAAWLGRIESAQRAHPQDPRLQYLAAMACVHRGLWGKAQQQLAQAAPRLGEAALKARAWKELARLAEQRGDAQAAAQAWKEAALAAP
ncbi:heme biosynthesis protein HemY [Melaminivora alkalimesophila]|uniref:HemY protein n=1 Tax=Melaminivora alkalimesophila TaxID=1165852 RepID=A0A317RHD3_9BURK|nr:heme biosynthesis HemY N-terminal domain-containing protein [Melaminivora alkalimesophila]PWW48855.1 HemY protein [Melaminivora alkalimesophila]